MITHILSLSVTPSITKTVLTPWKKSPKNQGVYNTLDNSRTPHLNFQHLEDTLEKFHQHCAKWILKFQKQNDTFSPTPPKKDQNRGMFCTLDNRNSFFKHFGTLTNALPTPPKIPIKSSQH